MTLAETEEHCLLDGIDPDKGRYVVFDRDRPVSQNDDPGVAMDAARAMGVKSPVFVDTEIMRSDYIHVY